MLSEHTTNHDQSLFPLSPEELRALLAKIAEIQTSQSVQFDHI